MPQRGVHRATEEETVCILPSVQGYSEEWPPKEPRIPPAKLPVSWSRCSSCCPSHIPLSLCWWKDTANTISAQNVPYPPRGSPQPMDQQLPQSPGADSDTAPPPMPGKNLSRNPQAHPIQAVSAALLYLCLPVEINKDHHSENKQKLLDRAVTARRASHHLVCANLSYPEDFLPNCKENYKGSWNWCKLIEQSFQSVLLGDKDIKHHGLQLGDIVCSKRLPPQGLPPASPEGTKPDIVN